MIKIEKNVPIPVKAYRNSERYNAFESLDIGDSFPIHENHLIAWRNARNGYNKDRNPGRVQQGLPRIELKIARDHKGNWRCWRMPPVTYAPPPRPYGELDEHDDDD